MIIKDFTVKFLPIPNHKKVVDLTGYKFGRLTVLGYVGKIGRYCSWLCECICGNTTAVNTSALKSGRSKSCGCLHNELFSAIRKTHGKSATPLHRVWLQMRGRCNNPKNKQYNDYGGRGIKVCERWSSFENFLVDMGERPTNKHSIERVDNDGDYCLENCKWALVKEQANNKRNSRFLSYKGESKTIAQWAEKFGVSYWFIRDRLRKGWTIDDIFKTLNEVKQNEKQL